MGHQYTMFAYLGISMFNRKKMITLYMYLYYKLSLSDGILFTTAAGKNTR